MIIVSYETQKPFLSQYLPPAKSYKSSKTTHPPQTTRTIRESSIKIQYSALRTIDSIHPSTHITCLILNYCHLKTLLGVQQFTLLETLEAKYNHIENISDLSHNRGLKRLNLIGNKVCRNGGVLVKEIQSMKLNLIEINGLKAIDFKKIYSMISSNVMTSIETEQDISKSYLKGNPTSTIRGDVYPNQSQNPIVNLRYESIDDIDSKLKKCAAWFHRFSLLSKAFVGLKNQGGSSNQYRDQEILDQGESDQGHQNYGWREQSGQCSSKLEMEQDVFQRIQNLSFNNTMKNGSIPKEKPLDIFSGDIDDNQQNEEYRSYQTKRAKEKKKQLNLNIEMINAFHESQK